MNVASGRVLDRFITSNIIRLGAKYTKHGEMLLKAEKDMSVMEWRVLVWMEQLVEPTVSQLSQVAAQDPDDLKRAIGGLAVRGFVQPVLEEGQEERFALTEAGDKLFDEVLPIMQRRQDLLVEQEDPDEISMFLDMLHRLEARADSVIAEMDQANEAKSG